jgi:hypothetical protein
MVRRTGNVVLREFGRRAHVDPFGVCAERVDGDLAPVARSGAAGGIIAARRAAVSTGQTLSSSFGCAAAVG